MEPEPTTPSTRGRSRRKDPVVRAAPAHARTAEEWDPATFPAYVAAKQNYKELHTAIVEAARPVEARRILDLGVGTGHALGQVATVHTDAELVGLDANKHMLDAALDLLGSDATMVHGRMEGSLPPGPFDLVVSALAVHHLDAGGKRALFAKVEQVLSPGGRFVLGDLIKDPNVLRRVRRSIRDYGVLETARSIVHRRTKGKVGYVEPDQPDVLADLVVWFRQAGLVPEVTWTRDLLVVIAADKPRASAEGPDGVAAADRSANA